MKKSRQEDGRDHRTLIFAPTGRDAQLTARFLLDAGLPAEVCRGMTALCREMNKGAGLIFITGEALDPESTDCLIDALSVQPAWSDIPLVVLTSGGGETPANADSISALSEAGNVTIIERPVRVMTLMSTLKSALRARRRQYEVRDYLVREAHSKEALRLSEERLREALASERAARTQAEESSRLKDEFLATVSHELRTPLTAVLGWTRLLRGGRLDEKTATHALETVERNAHSQQQLVEDLLDVSRIISGKLRLDVRAVSPASFIDAAYEAMLPAAQAKDIRLEKVLDEDAPAVPGDPDRLQQVVWNLLSNAIKFTERGGRVTIRSRSAGQHLEVSVEDTGEGIGGEFLPFVFDRFRQADGTTSRKYGGLGLGLAIVRHLVELHGGSVHAESSGEGKGSTFTVRLPLGPVYVREVLQEAVGRAGADGGSRPDPGPETLGGLKVLVVDDEDDTLEVIKFLLAQCGAEVSTARSAEEALGLVGEVEPDVVVSDIGMPGEDGFEFIRKLRGLPAESGGRTPAVALTAYARSEDRQRALRSGYQNHLSKPVALEELVAAIAGATGRV